MHFAGRDLLSWSTMVRRTEAPRPITVRSITMQWSSWASGCTFTARRSMAWSSARR
jgi:hypothetical protein